MDTEDGAQPDPWDCDELFRVEPFKTVREQVLVHLPRGSRNNRTRAATETAYNTLFEICDEDAKLVSRFE
jgi:hypothetical protein